MYYTSIDYNITMNDVRDYLHGLDDRNIVGAARSSYDCLIARVIQAKYPHVTNIKVGGNAASFTVIEPAIFSPLTTISNRTFVMPSPYQNTSVVIRLSERLRRLIAHFDAIPDRFFEYHPTKYAFANYLRFTCPSFYDELFCSSPSPAFRMLCSEASPRFFLDDIDDPYKKLFAEPAPKQEPESAKELVLV